MRNSRRQGNHGCFPFDPVAKLQGAILNLSVADDRIVKAMDELQDIVSKVLKNSLQ